MKSLIATVLGCLLCPLVFADGKAEFKRTIPLAPADHIILDVSVPRGDVTITYSHAGEIAIAATARSADEKELPPGFFETCLAVDRKGEHVQIRSAARPECSGKDVRMSFTINVPAWIEVNSTVGEGKQAVAGVMGPVKLVSGSGDIRAVYITTTLDARTGSGDIAVVRVGSAATVETGAGNIRLKDIGPASAAVVEKGAGRIEMDGVSGGFSGSTDAGELDARGGVFGDWDLRSVSGNIRIGIDAESKFEIDAATVSGDVAIENDDMESVRQGEGRACRQKVHGGGRIVRVRSGSGTIFIK